MGAGFPAPDASAALAVLSINSIPLTPVVVSLMPSFVPQSRYRSLTMSTSGILAGLTALVVGVVPAGAAAQHPDLAGSWKLNQAQSDNPRDQMRGSDSSGGERSRGEGGVGGFGRPRWVRWWASDST